MLIFQFFSFVTSNQNAAINQTNNSPLLPPNQTSNYQSIRPKIYELNQTKINQEFNLTNTENSTYRVMDHENNKEIINNSNFINNSINNISTENHENDVIMDTNITYKETNNNLTPNSQTKLNNTLIQKENFHPTKNEIKENYSANDNKIIPNNSNSSELLEGKNINTPQPTQKIIDLFSPIPKQIPERTVSPTPVPTPQPTKTATISPSRSPTMTPTFPPTPSPSLSNNNENEAIFNGKVKNAIMHQHKHISIQTETSTPIPTPTQSPVVEFRDDDDFDDNQEIDNIPPTFERSYEAKKDARGSATRPQPTPSKQPLITWDDFMSQTSTSIYLGLVGFAFGLLYAWYAYILNPNPSHNPIPAIFRGNGVDLEEVDPKREEELDRPRAF